ncbi:Conserved_hypothetical protein [Hexamita inflata]|uniref:Ankyrin repeat-containing protein n=1 Tax=Hexamita inflata TaxID=28002 RepID=A0AA86NVA6_9EUKA|nr:Conserved hypothetical protein [Hexamita inflata]
MNTIIEDQIFESMNDKLKSPQQNNNRVVSAEPLIKGNESEAKQMETKSGTQPRNRIRELDSINYVYVDEIYTAKEILEQTLKDYTPNEEDNLTLHNFLHKTFKLMESTISQFEPNQQQKKFTRELEESLFEEPVQQPVSYLNTLTENNDQLNDIVLQFINCKSFMSVEVDHDYQYVQNLVALHAKFLSENTFKVFVYNIQDLKTHLKNNELQSEYYNMVLQINEKVKDTYCKLARRQCVEAVDQSPKFSNCELLKAQKDKFETWKQQRTNRNVFHFMKLNTDQFQYVLNNTQILHQDSVGIYAISDMCVESIDSEVKSACTELNAYAIQLLNIIKQISCKEAQKQALLYFIKAANDISRSQDNGLCGYIVDNLESVFEDKELLKELLLAKFDNSNFLHLLLLDKTNGDIMLKGYILDTFPQVDISAKVIDLCKRLEILPQLIIQRNIDGQTPLMLAISNNYEYFNKDLLAEGDLSVDVENNNLLHYYINYFVSNTYCKQQPWQKILDGLKVISQKVDVNKLLQQENVYGYTPVHLGSYHIELLQFFDEHNVDFKRMSQKHTLFTNGSGESLKFLLNKGCDLLQAYGDPKVTSLERLAEELTSLDVEVIIKHGYDQITVAKTLMLHGNTQSNIKCILGFNIEPSLSLTQTFFQSLMDYQNIHNKDLAKQLAEKLQVDNFETEESLKLLLSKEYIDNSVLELICSIKTNLNLEDIQLLSQKINNKTDSQKICILLTKISRKEDQTSSISQIATLMPEVLSQDLVDQLVSTFVYTDSVQLTDLKHFTYNLIKDLDKSKLELAFSKVVSFRDEDQLLHQLLKERDLSLKHQTLKMPEMFYLVPNERDEELMLEIQNSQIDQPKLQQITQFFSVNHNNTMYYKDIPCCVIGFKEENNQVLIMNAQILIDTFGVTVRVKQTCISTLNYSNNVQSELYQCRPYEQLFAHGSENMAFQFFLSIIYQNTNQTLEQIALEQDETYSDGYKFNISYLQQYDVYAQELNRLIMTFNKICGADNLNYKYMFSLLFSLNENQKTFQQVIKYKHLIDNVENLSILQLKSLYLRLSQFQSYPTNLTKSELINFVKGSVSQAVALLRCAQCMHKHPIDDKLPQLLINSLGYERESVEICGVKVSVITKMPVINPFEYQQISDEKTSLVIQFKECPTSQDNFSCSQIVGVGVIHAILDGNGNKTSVINKIETYCLQYLYSGVIAFVE